VFNGYGEEAIDHCNQKSYRYLKAKAWSDKWFSGLWDQRLSNRWLD